jgi:Zn-dependent protease with chaperone function
LWKDSFLIIISKQVTSFMVNTIQISDEFKKMATKAMLSIVLFILVYVCLVALAVGLTIVFGAMGIGLIYLHPAFLTLMLGIGLISVGFLILFFLIKFIFKKHVVDRSHLIEITREDEPKLFACIEDIVKDVQTDFPKKVYLSSNVNASVFYDSSFWSMFFPIKKNLQIGLGLVNVVNVSEFKAILAHEFGHFSQKSMKIGSYVYNVNQVIFNMLQDNEGYSSAIEAWANISSYFAIFVNLAIKIVIGIQWILGKMYNVINLNYMSLSREMEFHADEVAANVTGAQPLMTSLMRLDLADQSFGTVLNFYSNRIATNVKTNNIYPQHQFVMNFLAQKNDIALVEGLPDVSETHLNQFNKSKLVIKNQWASHPSTEDRVAHLKALNIETRQYDNQSAWAVFSNREAIEEQLTNHLFANVQYAATPEAMATDAFTHEYVGTYEKYALNPIYEGFYDNRNPIAVDIQAVIQSKLPMVKKGDAIFSRELKDLTHELTALEADMNVLTQINTGNTSIKTFDYDGQKYTQKETAALLTQLSVQLEKVKKNIETTQLDVFKDLYVLAKNKGKDAVFIEKYKQYMATDKKYDIYYKQYVEMMEALQFVHESTPYEGIENGCKKVFELEKTFKTLMRELQNDAAFSAFITPEIKKNSDAYTSFNLKYFTRPNYDQSALDTLFGALSNYVDVINEVFFKAKKDLLAYQADELLTA